MAKCDTKNEGLLWTYQPTRDPTLKVTMFGQGLRGGGGEHTVDVCRATGGNLLSCSLLLTCLFQGNLRVFLSCFASCVMLIK